MTQIPFSDVSDTAIWVAHYRAKETERPNALFRDPLAKVLSGERGRIMNEKMKTIGFYAEWSVISRTVIIDDYIQQGLREGVDTIINLGAGLDTRPYRMDLPKDLLWVEVDFKNIIDYKNAKLQTETPRCRLERAVVDLASDEQRREFLQTVAPRAKKIMVITEGVIPYLSEEQVSRLGADLHSQARFAFWVAEYHSPKSYRYFQQSWRMKQMQNAPFRFFPENWLGFFEKLGWVPQQIQYSGEIAQKYGRELPMPWWAKLLLRFAKPEVKEAAGKMLGFILFKRS